MVLKRHRVCIDSRVKSQMRKHESNLGVYRVLEHRHVSDSAVGMTYAVGVLVRQYRVSWYSLRYFTTGHRA
eukprot:3941355-Rhodomonas_salina.2